MNHAIAAAYAAVLVKKSKDRKKGGKK